MQTALEISRGEMPEQLRRHFSGERTPRLVELGMPQVTSLENAHFWLR